MRCPFPLPALLAAIALTGCTDHTAPAFPDASPIPRGGVPAAARVRLARRVALALADREFRHRLKQDLDRSPVREHKLHFQRYLFDRQGRAGAMARAAGESPAAVELDAGRSSALEMYFPVPEHRAAWSGDDNILVATTEGERLPPVAYTPEGRRVVLEPGQSAGHAGAGAGAGGNRLRSRASRTELPRRRGRDHGSAARVST